MSAESKETIAETTVNSTIAENGNKDNVVEKQPLKADTKQTETLFKDEKTKNTVNPLQKELDDLKEQLKGLDNLNVKIKETEKLLKDSKDSNAKLKEFQDKQIELLLTQFNDTQKEKFKGLDYDTILEISKMTKTTVQSQGVEHTEKLDTNSKAELAKKKYNSYRSNGKIPPKGLYEEAYPR